MLSIISESTGTCVTVCNCSTSSTHVPVPVFFLLPVCTPVCVPGAYYTYTRINLLLCDAKNENLEYVFVHKSRQ